MAATTGKARCIICGKDRSAVRCEGCLQIFCYNHLTDHRQELDKQLDGIEVNRDIFRETLTQQTTDSKQNSLIKQIDEWEEDSIRKIQQIAEESRQLLFQYRTEHITQIEVNLNKLTEELRQIRQENDFNEIDLNQFKEKLTQLAEELDQPLNVSVQQDSGSPVNKISVIVSSGKESPENLQQQHQINDELLQNPIKSIRMELNEMNTNQHDYELLKTSFIEIEKRCIKHQKSEIEVKRQLTVYENLVNELKREIQDLTERLSASVKDYETLFRKYTALEHRKKLNHHKENSNAAATTTTTLSNEIKSDEEGLTTFIRNTYKIQQDQENKTTSSARTLFNDVDIDVPECPMCYCVFPEHSTVDKKKEHIVKHFE